MGRRGNTVLHLINSESDAYFFFHTVNTVLPHAEKVVLILKVFLAVM